VDVLAVALALVIAHALVEALLKAGLADDETPSARNTGGRCGRETMANMTRLGIT
jgi:hypothetical protein